MKVTDDVAFKLFVTGAAWSVFCLSVFGAVDGFTFLGPAEAFLSFTMFTPFGVGAIYLIGRLWWRP